MMMMMMMMVIMVIMITMRMRRKRKYGGKPAFNLSSGGESNITSGLLAVVVSS